MCIVLERRFMYCCELSDSCSVGTQYVVVRRKDSLVAQPKRRRIGTYRHSSRALWDPEEVQNLIKGVKLYGIGRWMKIRKNFEFAEHRTNVDLKDKWRNLQGRH